MAFYGGYSLITQSHVYIQDFNFIEILVSFTLANYFIVPQYTINGVAWILVIIGLFYFSCFILLPLLKKRPKVSIVTLISFTTIVIALSKSFGSSFFLFAVSVSYIPYLLMGQILFYWWKKKISTSVGIVFSIITYLVSVQGLLIINSDFYLSTNSYGTSFVYAYLVFLIALLVNEKIQVGHIIGFYSKISYSFFLNSAVGLAFISVFFPLIGFSASLFIALVILTTISYLSWRYVEMFFWKLARKLLALSPKKI